jgi:hypothetical protein
MVFLGGIEPPTSRLSGECSTAELQEHGGRWVELNALPLQELVYSQPPGPPSLTCTSHKYVYNRSSQGIEPCLPLAGG